MLHHMQHTLDAPADEGLLDASASDAQRPALSYLRKLQGVVRAASLATSLLVVALPIYAGNFGASGLEKGLLFSIPAFMMAISRPVIGKSMDRFGRKPFLVASVALMFIAMVLFALARTFTLRGFGVIIVFDAATAVNMLFAARTVQGFALGTMLLASYTITGDLARTTRRGSSFGYTEEAQYRGGVIGGLIAIPALLLFGFNLEGQLHITEDVWSLIFSIFAVSALLGVWRAIRDVPETRQWALSESEQPIHLQRIDPQLYVLMGIVVLTMASSYGLAPFILIYIQEHLTSNLLLIGLAYVPAALIWAFLPSRLGRLADRVGRRAPIVVGLTTSGVFSLTIPFLSMLFPNPLMAVAALALFATLEAACYSAAVPAEQAMVADMTGGGQRGAGFGLYTLAQSLGQVIGPLVMGLLYDQHHSGPFLANAVILTIGSLMVWLLLRERPRRARA